MTISNKTWKKYIKRLERIDKAAAEKMMRYLETHDWFENTAGQQEAIDYAYAVVTRYGEAAAEAACLFYDEIAESFVRGMIPAAEPALTPHYKEVERAVDATGKLGNKNAVSQAIGRLVKRTGADTTLQNAIRDGAEWAWIPSGDTCAFCLALASRGWQRASRQALKHGHAEHIHANCDCAYMVRFNSNTQVAGYDPDKYLQMYNDADGHSAKEKVNALRRMQYARHKDVINAQKRAAYAERITAELATKKENIEKILMEGKTSDEICSTIVNNHEALGSYTPEEMKIAWEDAGFETRPLGTKSASLNEIPFDDGGGYRVAFYGDGYFQYHPERGSHHGAAYWKIKNGKINKRYGIDGKNEITN